MSAEQWEGLAEIAGGWAAIGPRKNLGVEPPQALEFLRWRGDEGLSRRDVDGMFAGLALFARLMAVAMRSAPYADECSASRDIPDDWAIPPRLGHPSHELIEALRRYHDGSDRGELRALLCDAWGASPPAASDLRGLAARENGR